MDQPDDARARALTDEQPRALTYEQARDELVEVVRRLEAGGVPLEESLALWERGEELAATCEAWLQGARQRVSDRTGGRDEDGSD